MKLKEETVTSFELLFYDSPGGSEEKNEKLHSLWPVSGPRFDTYDLKPKQGC
jgi:hypothetical protein